jgi:hypothetical protein
LSGVPDADCVAGGQASHQRQYSGDQSGRRRPPPGDPPSPAAQFQDIVTGPRPVTVRNGHPSNLFDPSLPTVRGESWEVKRRRLEQFGRGSTPIGEDWQEALGDPRRAADWTAYFRREVTGQPWRGCWDRWPRLLPGVAAAALRAAELIGR